MSTIAIHPSAFRAVPRARATAPTATVRLTRRGRVVVVLLFLALAFALLTAFGARSAATGDHGTPVPTRTVVVQKGDTLWDIASDAAAPGQTRSMMLRIKQLNALSSSMLQEGQVLAVPTR